MIKASPDNTDQLTTHVNHPRVWPLVVTPVPLLHASLHLSHVVGSQRQALETTTSGHRTRRDEVVQQQGIQGTERTPWTLHGLVDDFGQQIGCVGIVASGPGILDIVLSLELLEALHMSIVDVLGIRDKLRRRRSIGGRHFVWRTG